MQSKPGFILLKTTRPSRFHALLDDLIAAGSAEHQYTIAPGDVESNGHTKFQILIPIEFIDGPTLRATGRYEIVKRHQLNMPKFPGSGFSPSFMREVA